MNYRPSMGDVPLLSWVTSAWFTRVLPVM